jgi:hypothetical protein
MRVKMKAFPNEMNFCLFELQVKRLGHTSFFGKLLFALCIKLIVAIFVFICWRCSLVCHARVGEPPQFCKPATTAPAWLYAALLLHLHPLERSHLQDEVGKQFLFLRHIYCG